MGDVPVDQLSISSYHSWLSHAPGAALQASRAGMECEGAAHVPDLSTVISGVRKDVLSSSLPDKLRKWRALQGGA